MWNQAVTQMTNSSELNGSKSYRNENEQKQEE